MGSAISAVLPLQNRYAMSVVYPYVNHMVLFCLIQLNVLYIDPGRAALSLLRPMVNC